MKLCGILRDILFFSFLVKPDRGVAKLIYVMFDSWVQVPTHNSRMLDVNEPHITAI